MASVETPIGRLWLGGDQRGLARISFEPGADGEPPEPIVLEARDQLEAYFAGRLERFELPLAPRGTEFQKLVWTAVASIPYGSTATYSEVAVAIGRPRASRAVGAANGRNPLAIVVPCHRIVGAAGGLTGYGGGLERKRALLDLEAGAG